ncbi:hypothetical protein [Streptomyces sp. NPDC101393]|uniref:hypothetical protein n=1 Tax=Streptomyces sp. NPDC101393 TaxID=3366141 RepID=UPI00382486BC
MNRDQATKAISRSTYFEGGTLADGLKVRIAARVLVEAYPEVGETEAQQRAANVLQDFPRMSGTRVGNRLVTGEEAARIFETMIGRRFE